MAASAGDDCGHALAHVEHFSGCEGMVRAYAVGLAVGGTDFEGEGHGLGVRGEVLAGDYGDDAVEGEGGGGVDLTDAGVRVGAADKGDVVHAGQLQVADVGAASGDETGIFLALDVCAHVGCVCHRESPFLLCRTSHFH